VKRSTERILTTHVGSLVRTPEIIEAMMCRELGKPVDPEKYEATLNRDVAEVVRQQADVGLDAIDDGEFGKVGFMPYVTERLSGLQALPLPPPEDPDSPARALYPEPERYSDFYRGYAAQETTQWLPDTPSRPSYHGSMAFAAIGCTGPIEYRPGQLKRDLGNLKQALEGVAVQDVFVPVAAPSTIEMAPNLHYSSQEEYLFGLAEALSVEYHMIADAGFIVQVDDPILSMQRQMSFAGKSLAEYKKWAQVRVEALNSALEGIPEDRVRYHMCFGSQNIPHTIDPPLKDIIDVVLQVNAQAYLLESANPRHEYEWQLWRDVDFPDGKILIPGVVSHCTNVVEHPELVALRLSNFASLIGRENVIGGTDCGFSQFWNLIRVPPEIQWAKLGALVEGARLASTRLWN